jgi:MarR-like DNA-binding transcriptional regulator SgrR of sgrS sRNA
MSQAIHAQESELSRRAFLATTKGVLFHNGREVEAAAVIGCGPFKSVERKRHTTTVVDRFENYFETDAWKLV